MTDNDTANLPQLGDSPLPTRLTTPMFERLRAANASLQEAATLASSMSKWNSVNPEYRRTHRPKLKGGGYGEPLGDQAVVNAAAAIMYAASLGIDPVQALRQVHTIGNSCGLESRTMQALCMQRGVRFAFDPANNHERAIVAAEREGHKPVSSEWTMQRAEVRGYTSNPMYQSHPDEMLRAKALAECCRLIAPDIILGLDYTSEELQLEETVVQVTAERVPRKGGVAALKESLKAEPAPPPPDPDEGPTFCPGPAPEPVGTLPPEPIGELPAVFAMVRDEVGVELAAQMELVGQILGRKVAGWEQVTADDCTELLLVLTVPPAPEGE